MATLSTITVICFLAMPNLVPAGFLDDFLPKLDVNFFPSTNHDCGYKCAEVDCPVVAMPDFKCPALSCSYVDSKQIDCGGIEEGHWECPDLKIPDIRCPEVNCPVPPPPVYNCPAYSCPTIQCPHCPNHSIPIIILIAVVVSVGAILFLVWKLYTKKRVSKPRAPLPRPEPIVIALQPNPPQPRTFLMD